MQLSKLTSEQVNELTSDNSLFATKLSVQVTKTRLLVNLSTRQLEFNVTTLKNVKVNLPMLST
jgi:hypothetical protein